MVPIRLPPLRERTDDIPELARHFLDRAVIEGLGAKAFDDGAMAYLKEYDWPGNVRELENLIRRLAALHAEEVIGRDVVAAELGSLDGGGGRHGGGDEGLAAAVESHLIRYFEAHRGDLPASGLYERVIREVERPLISQALSATAGNQLQAARMLGLNRNTLRKKIRDLGIEVVRGAR